MEQSKVSDTDKVNEVAQFVHSPGQIMSYWAQS